MGGERREQVMKYAIGIGLAVLAGVALWAGKDDIRRMYKISLM